MRKDTEDRQTEEMAAQLRLRAQMQALVGSAEVHAVAPPTVPDTSAGVPDPDATDLDSPYDRPEVPE